MKRHQVYLKILLTLPQHIPLCGCNGPSRVVYSKRGVCKSMAPSLIIYKTVLPWGLKAIQEIPY